MYKSIIIVGLSLGFSSFAMGQYYYKDLLSNKQVVADLKAYKENKVKKIIIKSYEDDGSESEGFFCEKKITKNYQQTELFTRANIAAASLFTSTFNADGALLSTKDSSDFVVSSITYTYNSAGQIETITSNIQSKDDDFESTITEVHRYTYNNNVPTKMTIIKNGKDYNEIYFALDEKGNVTIEKDTKLGTKFYYYYDGKNRLTDIVQSTEYTKKLKPDYVFEYNSAGQITQMTAVEEGGTNYYVWKYNYENGLRTKERCYTDERKLMGSIEYEYK